MSLIGQYHLSHWLEEEEEVRMRKASAVGNLPCLWKMIIAKERWPVRSVHPARGRKVQCCTDAEKLAASLFNEIGPCIPLPSSSSRKARKSRNHSKQLKWSFQFPLTHLYGQRLVIFFVLLIKDYDYMCSGTDFTQEKRNFHPTTSILISSFSTCCCSLLCHKMVG